MRQTGVGQAPPTPWGLPGRDDPTEDKIRRWEAILGDVGFDRIEAAARILTCADVLAQAMDRIAQTEGLANRNDYQALSILRWARHEDRQLTVTDLATALGDHSHHREPDRPPTHPRLREADTTPHRPPLPTHRHHRPGRRQRGAHGHSPHQPTRTMAISPHRPPTGHSHRPARQTRHLTLPPVRSRTPVSSATAPTNEHGTPGLRANTRAHPHPGYSPRYSNGGSLTETPHNARSEPIHPTTAITWLRQMRSNHPDQETESQAPLQR